MKRYSVIGKYEGKKINEVVSANSKKQAKLRAGFNAGFGGYAMRGFVRSSKVRVRLK